MWCNSWPMAWRPQPRLDGEIDDTDASDRRHRVGRITDAQHPVQHHCGSRSMRDRQALPGVAGLCRACIDETPNREPPKHAKRFHRWTSTELRSHREEVEISLPNVALDAKGVPGHSRCDLQRHRAELPHAGNRIRATEFQIQRLG
jgi:hypothetical protein